MKTPKSPQIRKKPLYCAGLCLLPFAAGALLLLLKMLYAKYVMQFVPPCVFRLLTGKLCPSCGMTHSVFAICRLDFAEAARQNLIAPFGVLLALLCYAELWLRFCGKPRRLIPRQKSFWIGVLLFFLAYAVIRNLI
ncbi:MAG TPA: hypothetical protein DCG49_13010 [Ruminococcus sp.]|nr:hypothetical protein [Ruminococcus sp.]